MIMHRNYYADCLFSLIKSFEEGAPFFSVLDAIIFLTEAAISQVVFS